MTEIYILIVHYFVPLKHFTLFRENLDFKKSSLLLFKIIVRTLFYTLHLTEHRESNCDKVQIHNLNYRYIKANFPVNFHCNYGC